MKEEPNVYTSRIKRAAMIAHLQQLDSSLDFGIPFIHLKRKSQFDFVNFYKIVIILS